MKKVRFAIAVLLLIPISILALHSYLQRATESMSASIAQAESLERQGNTDGAEKIIKTFSGEWEKNKMIMETFVRHAELDPANMSAAKLLPYLENNEDSEFFAESESLKVQFKHILDTEKFSLENIL